MRHSHGRKHGIPTERSVREHCAKAREFRRSHETAYAFQVAIEKVETRIAENALWLAGILQNAANSVRENAEHRLEQRRREKRTFEIFLIVVATFLLVIGPVLFFVFHIVPMTR